MYKVLQTVVYVCTSNKQTINSFSYGTCLIMYAYFQFEIFFYMSIANSLSWLNLIRWKLNSFFELTKYKCTDNIEKSSYAKMSMWELSHKPPIILKVTCTLKPKRFDVVKFRPFFFNPYTLIFLLLVLFIFRCSSGHTTIRHGK